MPAHLSFLEQNASQIKAAGPLLAPSGDPAGGLWLDEADSLDLSRCARERRSILANWIASLGSHSELVTGLRGGQAANLRPFPLHPELRTHQL